MLTRIGPPNRFLIGCLGGRGYRPKRWHLTCVITPGVFRKVADASSKWWQDSNVLVTVAQGIRGSQNRE